MAPNRPTYAGSPASTPSVKASTAASPGKRNMWGNWVRNHVPQVQPLRHR